MKKDFKPNFLALLVLLAVNLSVSAQSEELSIQEFNDISYYEGTSDQPENTKLNLVIPEGIDNPPVFMWIGQGAWAYVDRNKEMNICRMMAKKGIAMASVGHRLSPALIWEPKNEEGVKHPQHVKDMALAFKWVYENSEKYGFSKENIFVGGYSSGAHLAALLAMDNRYLADLGLSNKMIKAIIPVGGGYNVPHYLEDLKKEDPAYEFNHINPVFGETHEEHIDASPVTYIDSLITPILMISEKDTYVYSKVFEDLLIERKINDFQVINAHNKTHAGLWTELGNSENSIYRNFIVDYIKQRSSE